MRKILLVLLVFFCTNAFALDVQGNKYSIKIDDSFLEVEREKEEFARTFETQDIKLRIFEQHIGNNDYLSYIKYGNRQLELGKADFKITSEKKGRVYGRTYYEISYNRPALKAIKNDKNYYTELHFVDRANKRVITFWLKAGEKNLPSLNATVKAIKKTFRYNNEFYRYVYNFGARIKENSVDLKGKKNELKIPENKLVWGRFYPGYPFYTKLETNMYCSEERLEHEFEIIMSYKTFPSDQPFPIEAVQKVYDQDRYMLLTLQPFTKDLNWIAIPEFIEGKYDDKIVELAEKLKSLDEPIFVRFMNEMNGDWDPWCTWFYGKDSDLYVEAWRHIVTIMKEHGGDNIFFVWNPHDRSYPNFEWNNPHMYYPGDEYVDWIGLTGYNNGTSHPGDVWREFDEIYTPVYYDYLKRYSDKPFMITEFSCNEVGGNKTKWIENGFKSLSDKYPNIKIAIWFDGRDNLWQYQIDSTKEAEDAFRLGLKNENFINNGINSCQAQVKMSRKK